MCIVALFYDESSKQLTVAANRDEFYERPAAPLHRWSLNDITIYGGRDLKESGTWLAVNEFGHFVAITNYRDPALEQPMPRSRGQIATDYLTSERHAAVFAKLLQQERHLYGPFNVLLYDGKQLIHYNNVTNIITPVKSGVHILCNATLNTPWPKVERLRQTFTNVLKRPSEEAFLTILQDEKKAPIKELPSTGIPLSLELDLSSIFIRLPHYGTRCSTICHLSLKDVSMFEQTYLNGEKTEAVSLTFSLSK